VFGVVAASALWALALPTYNWVVIVNYRVEQGLLADRAAARGEFAAEERHRRNVIASFSGEGFRTITRQAEDDFSSRAVLPLPMLLLDRMREGHAPPGHDGGDIVEAIERGRLATALERAGRIDEANAEWSRALHLWGGSDLQKFRSSIEAVSSVDSTAAQQAILGADQP